MVFEPLVGELSGNSLVRRVPPRTEDFSAPTHGGPPIHTSDRPSMAANQADRAEDLGFGLTAGSG